MLLEGIWQDEMLYLYAIIDGKFGNGPEVVGLEGAHPVELVYGDLAAVVSLLDGAEVPPTEANLWRHEAVVEALMADHAVLPVRFGTILPGEAAVQTMLSARYGEFSAALRRVRGRAELGLRVLWEGSRPWREKGGQRSAGSGRAYLLARLREEQEMRAWREEAEALAEQIHAPLAQLSAESTRQVLTTPLLLLTAAYLIERDQVRAFGQEIEALRKAYPALRFLCTGPWPPYSFVAECV